MSYCMKRVLQYTDLQTDHADPHIGLVEGLPAPWSHTRIPPQVKVMTVYK